MAKYNHFSVAVMAAAFLQTMFFFAKLVWDFLCTSWAQAKPVRTLGQVLAFQARGSKGSLHFRTGGLGAYKLSRSKQYKMIQKARIFAKQKYVFRAYQLKSAKYSLSKQKGLKETSLHFWTGGLEKTFTIKTKESAKFFCIFCFASAGSCNRGHEQQHEGGPR